MVNILCTTLLVVASLHVGLAYPQKINSQIELETHEASAKEENTKPLVDLEKELKAIIEDADVDKENEEEVPDENNSFMQDEYDNMDGQGMAQADKDMPSSWDESQQIITQNDDEMLISQESQRQARKRYYNLYRSCLNSSNEWKKRYKKYLILFHQSEGSVKIRYGKLYRLAKKNYSTYRNSYRRYFNLYRSSGGTRSRDIF